jgi:hypothetical protein
MSQYPKLAEFDFEGWHADPYIAREFHGVWEILMSKLRSIKLRSRRYGLLTNKKMKLVLVTKIKCCGQCAKESKIDLAF